MSNRYRDGAIGSLLGCALAFGISMAHAAPQTRAHQIVAGDNLSVLSKRYNVSVDMLAKANNITPKTTIVIGDTLNIPMPAANTTAAKKIPTQPAASTANTTKYQIKSGDTLLAIAKRYNVSVEALTAANDMTATTIIRAGDTLVLPKNAKAAPVTPAVTLVPKPQPSANSTPVATAVATSREMPDTYTVQAGDTLMGIANRYGISYQDIATASGIDANATLQIGQTLRLKLAPAVQTTAMAMVDDDIY
ncbi:lytic transglycosylase [Psychrobacter aestuarii]|uniref:LysM domain-containing protein n=1 Tax=Psychrobacter aestuarii TaxID=556327 RepID=A0ABP3FEI8_9GAMM|nr:LysM peptidoglycan-binding domain-containing protein [Psychrobacter aestuarii]